MGFISLVVDCESKKDRGILVGRLHVIRWYYDKENDICSRFWYGGSGGNGNRYKAEDECKQKCSGRSKILLLIREATWDIKILFSSNCWFSGANYPTKDWQ